MKKLFTLFTFLVTLKSTWAYDFEAGGLFYNILSDSIPYTAEVTSHPGFPYDESMTSVTIPEQVNYGGITYAIRTIGSSAFEDCYTLASVSIPNSVTSIESWAFRNCSALAAITIPNSVVSIKNDAFANSGIYNDESNWEDSVLYISDCLIQAKRGLTGAYVIKDGTRFIANGAFAGSSLTTITIPNTVTEIGFGAFQYSALTSVIIPNGVTTIRSHAFYHNLSLKAVTLPNSITKIQRDAFRDCSALTTVICEAVQVPECQHNIFYNIPFSEATLYVPEESIEGYKSAIYWKDFGTILPISNSSTDLECTPSDHTNHPSYIKMIHNGQLLILRDGNTYNIMGMRIK